MRTLITPLLAVCLTANAHTGSETMTVGGAYEEKTCGIATPLYQEIQAQGQNSEENIWKRTRSWKVGYGFPQVYQFRHYICDYSIWDIKPAVSISIQQSRTGYLHKQALGDRVRFGIDYGFCNLKYSRYSYTGGGVPFFENMGETIGEPHHFYTLEYGLHVGPSMNVQMTEQLCASIYAHAKPTFSYVNFDHNNHYTFVPSCAGGIQISYGPVGVGAECEWCPYSRYSVPNNPGNYLYIKSAGARVYVAYRF